MINYTLELPSLYSLANTEMVEKLLGKGKKHFYSHYTVYLDSAEDHFKINQEILESQGFVLETSRTSLKTLSDSIDEFTQLYFRHRDKIVISLKHSETTRKMLFITDKPQREAVQKVIDSLPGDGSNDSEKILICFRAKDSKRYRSVTLPSFSEIEENYSPEVVGAINKLLPLDTPEKDGKLIIWRGLPGSGKTFAVRALAREWAERHNVSITVITDPELFLADSDYMLDVILSDPHVSSPKAFHKADQQGTLPAERLQLIILEDQAQLFTTNCRNSQGFNSFLNLTDGLIGQGIRIMFLITFNEDIEDIDKAIRRKGRLLQVQQFQALSPAKAQEWLRDKTGKPVSESIKDLIAQNGGISLADLYNLLNSKEDVEEVELTTPEGVFGF